MSCLESLGYNVLYLGSRFVAGLSSLTIVLRYNLVTKNAHRLLVREYCSWHFYPFLILQLDSAIYWGFFCVELKLQKRVIIASRTRQRRALNVTSVNRRINDAIMMPKMTTLGLHEYLDYNLEKSFEMRIHSGWK